MTTKDPDLTTCEVCEQQILYCSCVRCMECEEPYAVEQTEDFIEDEFGYMICPSCSSLPPTVAEDVDDSGPYNDVPSKGGYVFWHNRGSDVVLIGPFPSITAARSWYNTYGVKLGVSPMLTDLRAPADTYNGLWGLYPEEEK